MAVALAALLHDALPGLRLGATDPAGHNRVTLEGLTFGPAPDGTLELRAQKLELASVRVAAGRLQLEIGRIALHQLVAPLRTEAGALHLAGLQAANAELAGVRVHGPLELPHAAGHATGHTTATGAGHAWSLAPLAALDGTIRAEIVDAHLLFDADVTVPIRGGQVDFNEATVEHVGPDSRMGVSRLGIYVDAPNGRSYLYQFPATPVAGVEFEHRGALLGPRVSARGKLRLQDFAEGLLRQAGSALGSGFTAQARPLFDRTAVGGELRLGDGRFAAPGVEAELAGRAEGANVLRVHSGAVGRGLTAEVASLLVRNVALRAPLQGAAQEVTGSVKVQLALEGGQVHFTCDFGTVNITGLRLFSAIPVPASAEDRLRRG